RAEELPEALRELAYRNAVELTHARWDSDVKVLIEALLPHVDASPQEQKPVGGTLAREPGPSDGLSASRSFRLPLAGLGLVLAVAAGFAGYVWRSEAKTAAVHVPPKPEPCSARPGYPIGRWLIGAPDQSPDAYASFVIFTKSTSGTWLPTSGQGSFTASAAPRPEQEIVITFQPEKGPYRSINKLVVSSDGCRMQGTYSDTEDHHGEATYTWQG
ncbi:MAG TPA: hypothetical protein VF103_18760, partial [Polyangiaceae bacterium]